MTKRRSLESTAKLTKSAVFADSFTNSISMPELVDVSGMPATVCCEFEFIFGPQLLIVTGELD